MAEQELFPNFGIRDFLNYTKPYGYFLGVLLLITIVLAVISWRSYFKNSNRQQGIVAGLLGVVLLCFLLSYFYMWSNYKEAVLYVKFFGDKLIDVDTFLRALYLTRMVPLANLIIMIFEVIAFVPHFLPQRLALNRNDKKRF